VGAAPGPACFGRGGKEATITDASLLIGLFDPASYFGGGMGLDAERAKAAVMSNIAEPLGVGLEDALLRMSQAFEEKIAEELHHFTTITKNTVMLAFGGAGPMNACGVAEKAGISRVSIPHMAAVFSAYGIGACDISQRYDITLDALSNEGVVRGLDALKKKATRDMFAEGVAAGDYTVEARLVADFGHGHESVHPLNGHDAFPAVFEKAIAVDLELDAVKRLRGEDHGKGLYEAKTKAAASGSRYPLNDEKLRAETPVYRLADLKPGDFADGPAILEEDYFTCRVLEGWRLIVSNLGDVLLTREGK
jgi:N-methylhydantoinase A/oxoprolinase/acetone carboxylase beta subunit